MSGLDLDRLATDVEALLLALPRARRRGNEIVYSCPLPDRHHNGDAHPSASYSTSKKAHRCKGCGASGGLVKGKHPLANLLGLDLEPYRMNGTETRHAGRPDRSWDIRDGEGYVVAIHHRRDLADGGKVVKWSTPDNPFGLTPLKLADLPLYGADRLGTREPGDDAPVIVCEGEPATDALLKLGLRAVGTVTGANAVPTVKVLEVLRGEDVVLWPDSDDPGRAHMAQIAARLEGIAASVRIFAPDLEEKGDAVDWIRARAATPNLATVLLGAIETEAGHAQSQAPEFTLLADDVGYRLTLPALAATLEVTHLRRERHQLHGEVLARCTLPGAKTFDGTLSVADLNLSSSRSRSGHAAHLAEQAHTDADQWRDGVEEFAQRVLAAERAGEPDVCLPDVRPVPVQIVEVEGLRLPRHHPTVLFGDGDSVKSYLTLYTLGELARQGLRVGLADWELSESDHRERLGRLFQGELPPVRYLRGVRSIVHEADRLRRWVRDRKLDYVAMDSVAYASAGAPESAEIAMAYFQVVRQLGLIGSLHVAHITKAVEGADRRPFGSAFWHNSPRATWFAKLADRDPGGTVSRLGLYPRKWNVGPLPASVGLEFEFTSTRTIVKKAEITDTPDLAAMLTTKQRMIAALRSGGMKIHELAEEIEAKNDTVQKTAKRHTSLFSLRDGVVSLVERRAS